jgi:hypothetical protein
MLMSPGPRFSPTSSRFLLSLASSSSSGSSSTLLRDSLLPDNDSQTTPRAKSPARKPSRPLAASTDNNQDIWEQLGESLEPQTKVLRLESVNKMNNLTNRASPRGQPFRIWQTNSVFVRSYMRREDPEISVNSPS